VCAGEHLSAVLPQLQIWLIPSECRTWYYPFHNYAQHTHVFFFLFFKSNM